MTATSMNDVREGKRKRALTEHVFDSQGTHMHILEAYPSSQKKVPLPQLLAGTPPPDPALAAK